MSASALLLLIQGIEAAIAAAPRVVELVAKAKDLVTALFTAKVITKDQQDALHARIDSQALMAAAGIIPAHWQVEPDPA